ncbi:CsbD family protein [Henriciella litoralis]|uniref:CsbD family protein n=1 Tax=Henriciella litoralis TaxID=568102 RepID=UPI000A00C458|nr:CsbD family protein [Henriciella litoralis]
MGNDKEKGFAKKVEGKAKEVAGVVTNDRELEAEGKAKQVEGEGQETFGEVKDALSGDKKKDQK